MAGNNVREELIKELSKLKIHQSMAGRDELGRYASLEQIGDIADFILARYKRVVYPLVKVRTIFSGMGWIELNQDNLRIAIDQTLKNVGVEIC